MTGFLLGAFLALLVGVAVGLQSVTNHALRTETSLGAMLLVNTAIVLAGALVFSLFEGGAFRAALAAPHAPWYDLLGGVYGFTIILLAPLVVHRLGATTGLTTIVAAQVATALVIDHLGAFGMTRSPLTWTRLAGVLLVVAGIVLTRK